MTRPDRATAVLASLAVPVHPAAERIDVYRGAPGGPQRIAFAPYTSRLAVLDATGSVYVWTPGPTDPVGPIRADGGIRDVRFDRTDTPLLTTGPEGVQIWAPESGREFPGPAAGLNRNAVLVASRPGGAELAIADPASIWIGESGTARPRRTLPAVASHGLAYSEDGRLLASAGAGGVRLWNATTGALISHLPGSTGDAGVVFSPDGTQVAAAAGTRQVRVWHTGDGRPVGPELYVGDLSRGSAITFDEYSQELITCVEAAVRWWNPNNGYLFRPPVTLPTDATPTAAAFNPDATRVAVAGADGTVQLWALRR